MVEYNDVVSMISNLVAEEAREDINESYRKDLCAAIDALTVLRKYL